MKTLFMSARERSMTDDKPEDEDNMFVTFLGLAALALVAFGILVSVLSFTAAGREKATKLINE